MWIRKAQNLRRKGEKPTFEDLAELVDDEAAVAVVAPNVDTGRVGVLVQSACHVHVW